MDYAVIARAPEQLGVIIVENGLVTDYLRTTSLAELKTFIGERKIVEYALNMSGFTNEHEDVLRMARDRYKLPDNSLESICEATGVTADTEDVIEKCKTINDVYTVMVVDTAEKETPEEELKEEPKEGPNEESKEEPQEEQTEEPSEEKSDKDWTVTLLLCLFLGGFGAHRFYVKRTGSAIAIILTCFGFLGIWPLVDLIMIALGKFRDADGKLIQK